MEAAVHTAISAFGLFSPGTVYWSSWVEELMASFGNYPLNILPRFVQDTLTYLLPIAFLGFLPASMVTGRTAGLGIPVMVAALAPVIALLASIASRLAVERRTAPLPGHQHLSAGADQPVAGFREEGPKGPIPSWCAGQRWCREGGRRGARAGPR